jgi:hypothetical protein
MNYSDEIDYSKYDLRDLYDCRDHIDKEKYPERYQKILYEIERKEEENPKKNKEGWSISNSSPEQLRKILGWFEIITGTVGVVLFTVTIGLINGLLIYEGEFDPRYLLLFFAVFFPIPYFIAGISVLRGKKWGVYLSLILQYAAIIDISIEGLSWSLNPGLELGFSIQIAGIEFGIDFLAIFMVLLSSRLLRIMNSNEVVA